VSYGKRLKNKIKESRKEPLFYLVIILVITLFGGLVFGSNVALKSLRGFSLLASAANTNKGLFIQSANNILRESPDITFVQKNSLMGISPTATIDVQVLGSIMGGIEDELLGSKKDIIEYIVESGDTLSSIASQHSISLQTVLGANKLNSKSVIKPGQKLIVLPITGVVYNIKKGDTLGEIAKTYKGKTAEIVAFNELSSEGDIFIGDILIIPNGQMPKIVQSSYANIPVGSSYFIPPLAKVNITQGLHWYNAIDFGGSCGTPIYAAAAGTVQRVEYGWNGGAGNYLRIIHPNGVVTMYGHIQKSLVAVGQNVSQGEMIALVGGKPGTPGAGISTGCHVHFDVRGAENPFR